MQLKDYYTTLEVAPAANAVEIKKSFRRLALKHHPDKNPGNASAEAQFREIQEAYETLSDPEKREEYNYKRWYSRSLNKHYSNEPLNAAAILAECIRLRNYMATANILRVDYDGLGYHIRQLLSTTNIAILQQANDKTIKGKVIEAILPSATALPDKYIPPIALLLMQLSGDDQPLIDSIINFTKQHKQKSNWQKYRAVVVLAITALLCWMIYRISK